MRHCSSAVSRDSHKPVNSKFVFYNGVNRVQSKIFVNNQKMYDCSKNWRADFHRFKGSTYAQVVKGKGKVNSNQAKFKAKVYSHANLTNHKGKALAIAPVNSKLTSKSGCMVRKVRVIRNQVPKKPFEIHTTNRFEPLTTLHKVNGPKQTITPGNHLDTGTSSEGVKKNLSHRKTPLSAMHPVLNSMNTATSPPLALIIRVG